MWPVTKPRTSLMPLFCKKWKRTGADADAKKKKKKLERTKGKRKARKGKLEQQKKKKGKQKKNWRKLRSREELLRRAPSPLDTVRLESLFAHVDVEDKPVVEWYSVKMMKTNFGFIVINATMVLLSYPKWLTKECSWWVQLPEMHVQTSSTVPLYLCKCFVY